MLAIITKMTLTQVSTWFRQRRRLKKENKMTWAPKNKGGEERKEEGGTEELLGCLNGDTKGTLCSLPQLTWVFQSSNSLIGFSQPPHGIASVEGFPWLPLTPAAPVCLRAFAVQSVPFA